VTRLEDKMVCRQQAAASAICRRRSEVVFVDFFNQRRSLQSQKTCGLRDVTRRSIKGLPDQRALDVSQVLFQVQTVLGEFLGVLDHHHNVFNRLRFRRDHVARFRRSRSLSFKQRAVRGQHRSRYPVSRVQRRPAVVPLVGMHSGFSRLAAWMKRIRDFILHR